ncbi:MAG TPA: methyltransferase domain-containing protein [Bacteroidia bacterium]
MSSNLDKDFWDSRYENGETGWDLGDASPPLKRYIDQLEHKDLAILIPGCGNAYEAEYLIRNGFSNITLIDLSEALTDRLKEKFKNHESIKIICGNFFDLEGKFDLILEQTFFCAIDPSLRPDYVIKVHSLLNKSGRLAGLLFNRHFEKAGPPFGGDKSEYMDLFSKHFNIMSMDTATDSITPRAGNEFFIELNPIQS